VSFTNEHLVNVYLRYSDEQLLQDLEFAEISQRFSSNDFKYVIGKVFLSKLIAAQLNSRSDVFLVRYEEN
jgi:homoserine dehydrogenase